MGSAPCIICHCYDCRCVDRPAPFCGLCGGPCRYPDLDMRPGAVNRYDSGDFDLVCSHLGRGRDFMTTEKATASAPQFTAISEKRKATPMWSGVLRYFPDAIEAVARLSFKANSKHNPGEPLHWARGKSADHADCAVRHLVTPDEIDPETEETHAAAAAWRALALLQEIEEKRNGRRPKWHTDT